ncbi:WbqC family protein [Myxococcus llanfairpwllgwyngyllgogerychwyrndrobwllllantysiliogogogochensis]|uniref:WbqC family protein n=1 Tax=Myxococcus llanfairpwllgwyngyllgogerychwyrndrobwllllantysiliogogogochensis TaxID=2590453 RepID=A0A540WVW7_9BACT|nr:WbqC family protein [Myxococcus llanfairpwllgwyngyllgogerychwyrndrobwllllantysiliogogogochensis]NTX52911.1 WbqC family protein [Myxococcus sp. CA039A]TQF13117.1 WbqC family protein [Myxococcus llanfairpwllgwyngyllgogerychwyrndrobwllllantysiliogogogochensis]
MSGSPGVVVAEQPHYLPWVDFYEQVARAGTLLVLDNVQWLRRGWQRRTRVALPANVPTPPPTEPGFQWLSIPLEDPHRDTLIGELAVDTRQPWARKHLSRLVTLYGQRPHFATQVLPLLEPFYDSVAREAGPGSLLRVLLGSTALFHESLGMKPDILLASTLERQGDEKSARLVEYCRQLKAHTYYSGLGSSLYLQVSLFRDADVRVLWQRFRHPPYAQGREGRFVQGLSIVDVLSNVPVEEVRRWLEPSPWGPFAPAPTGS